MKAKTSGFVLRSAIAGLILALALGAACYDPTCYHEPEPEGKADLVVRDITWSPTDASAGDNVFFAITVENRGSADAHNFRVGYRVDSGIWGYRFFPLVSAGNTSDHTFSWRSLPGNHTVEVVADYFNSVRESDEGNNVKQVVYSGPTAIEADLLIRDIGWYPPDPLAGEMVELTITVENQGTADARDFRVGYRVDSGTWRYRFFSLVPAGGIADHNFSWRALPGNHTVEAAADYFNVVGESDESNNTKQATLSGPTGSDLVVEDISWLPANPLAGDKMIITTTVKNRGGTGARSTVLSHFIDGDYESSDFILYIAPGENARASFLWDAEPGTHTIRAVANYDSSMPDADEDGDWKEVVFQGPPAADLVMQSLDWSPWNPKRNDRVTFNITVWNRGMGTARASTVKLFINNWGVGSSEVSEMHPGLIITGSFAWTATAGTHAVRVVVDYHDNVPESNEGNNEFYTKIEVPLLP